MIIARLSASDYATQPWKNGGGSTTQLAVGAPVDNEEPWPWRVSIADVNTSGPFSNFEGIDRIIMLIKGRGMFLSFDGAPAQRIDRCHVPFAFDGGCKTDCRLLDGPVRDLNLMVDRRFGHGTMDVINVSAAPVSLSLDNGCHLFHCLDGRIDASVSTQRITLAKDETLRIDGGAGQALKLRPGADNTTLVHMTVRPR